jgi:hypothetical protein
MKTTLTLFLAIFAFTTISQAQCSREDQFEAIDDPAQYPVSGTASLEFQTDGSKQVVFADDFVTVQGIELRVFLSSTPRLAQGGSEIEVTTEPLQDDNGGQDMNDPITGMKTFDVPASVNLSDFDYIIIQCVQADVLWGRADLGSNQGPDCSTLGVIENNLDQVNVYPNPASDNFSISGLQNPAEIAIFDVLGKRVLAQQISGVNPVNVTDLKAGLYLLRIMSQGQQITQKLIIQ